MLGYFFLLHLILCKYHLFTFEYTHPILFKTQEYLCLAIFEKPMIQVCGKTILSMEFKSIIKAHGLNPWQFIYPKPNLHWQYQSPIHIGNIKAQFSLAISKPNSYWQYQSPIFIGTTLSKRKRAQDYQCLAKKKYNGKMLPWQKGPWQSSYKRKNSLRVILRIMF